jgi:thioredoxin reductase (NADPH)
MTFNIRKGKEKLVRRYHDEVKNMLYDVIIIGSGPAGLTAAIYAQRAMLNTVIIEKQPMSGGQILNTYEVDNYPGLPGMGGFELGTKLRQHADGMGAKFLQEEVDKIIKTQLCYQVLTPKAEYSARTLVFATGASHRKLGIPGEKEFAGIGVSYCATCDGAFFRNKVSAVAGGGDVALEDALYLSKLCQKVWLIHRRDELRGAKVLQEQIFQTKNIEIIWDSNITAITGNNQVEKIEILNNKTKNTHSLNVDGVFIAVGLVPNSEKAEGLVSLNQEGYIIAGEDGKTDSPGFFAAGDVRTKQLRQVITAASDGANVITSVEKYLYGL